MENRFYYKKMNRTRCEFLLLAQIQMEVIDHEKQSRDAVQQHSKVEADLKVRGK